MVFNMGGYPPLLHLQKVCEQPSPICFRGEYVFGVVYVMQWKRAPKCVDGLASSLLVLKLSSETGLLAIPERWSVEPKRFFVNFLVVVDHFHWRAFCCSSSRFFEFFGTCTSTCVHSCLLVSGKTPSRNRTPMISVREWHGPRTPAWSAFSFILSLSQLVPVRFFRLDCGPSETRQKADVSYAKMSSLARRSSEQ